MVLLFSSSWVTYLVGVGLDFILFVPLLPSHCSFFFVFGHGVSFFGGFQHLPVDGCSIASCNFGAFHGRRWAHVLRLHHLEQETLVNNF